MFIKSLQTIVSTAPVANEGDWDVCSNLGGVNPDFIMACIAFETGRSFDPCIKNSSNGATGIIQFTKSNAEYLGTNTDKLCKMTADEQLIYVEKHFKAVLGKNVTKLKTIEDVYMTIFLPIMVGKTNDTVIAEDGDKYYELNKGLDLDLDGKITKEEACYKVKKQYEDGQNHKN